VKREEYEVFKKDLDAAKADYRIIEYPGAVHAFTNPKPQNSAKSSTCRSGTTGRQTASRRPRC